MIGKALYWLLLICTIPTMIWGCFKIGGPLFIFVGIILTFSAYSNKRSSECLFLCQILSFFVTKK